MKKLIINNITKIYFYRARVRHYALQLFDNKKEAEEFCKIIDMHILKRISFIDLDLVPNVRTKM